MSCNNCFNSCSEITPDKCIRYTGADVTALGIQNGDTLLSVEQKIITALNSALDGTGVVFDMGVICKIIEDFLPISESTNLKEIVRALISAVCAMNTRLEDTEDFITDITQAYSTTCLGSIPQDLHSIIQATINKTCATATDLASFKTSVKTNYVKLSDLDALIQQYLDTH